MAAKLALIFVVAVCFFQFFALQSEANVVTFRERREAPAGNQKNDLEELLDSAKHSLDEFVSKIQSSELYQNATKVFDEFGKKVKATGDELLAKVTNGTQTPAT